MQTIVARAITSFSIKKEKKKTYRDINKTDFIEKNKIYREIKIPSMSNGFKSEANIVPIWLKTEKYYTL